MKKIISLAAFAVAFCCVHVETAKADIKPCSSYAEISCAGQQTYGWGCKPGATACSPSTSGACTCGSGLAGSGGSGSGTASKPAAAGTSGVAAAAGGSATKSVGLPSGQRMAKPGLKAGAGATPAAGLSVGTAKAQDRNIPGNQILPTSITEAKCAAKENCEVLQGQGPAFAKWCHCKVIGKHDYEIIK